MAEDNVAAGVFPVVVQRPRTKAPSTITLQRIGAPTFRRTSTAASRRLSRSPAAGARAGLPAGISGGWTAAAARFGAFAFTALTRPRLPF